MNEPSLALAHLQPEAPPSPEAALPAYLRETYAWAYLKPWSLRVFDHTPVVSAILWGNFRRLERAALAQVTPGGRTLQAACVYGPFSEDLAARVGPAGRLDVVDVAPIQVRNCARKLRRHPQARVRIADAAATGDQTYDTIVCFFLLHELPDAHKRRVVDHLLARLAPGGRAVFVDYHRPLRFHPVRWLTALVFRYLEPFARTLWQTEIARLSSEPQRYRWRKTTCFGNMFQLVVAEPEPAPCAPSPGSDRLTPPHRRGRP